MFDPQSPAAREIAELWWVMLALGVFAFLVFGGALVWGLVRRRSDQAGEGPRPGPLILGGGVVLPAILLSAVMFFTVQTMRETPARAEGALVIEVTGHRWWWEVRYPDHGVTTANEIHLPVGQPVEFHLSSADVIHSFWIPALSGKLDLLPEDLNILVIEATQPGVYRGNCAEFCGLQHAKMGLIAVAQPEPEFQQWLAGQQRPAESPAPALATEGRAVFLSQQCPSCHTIRGTSASGTGGPDLTHLASRRTIVATRLENDREHLARWITDPQAVKEGVSMEAASGLSDRELDALLTYLEGLK